MVQVGTIVWLASELMFFAGLFAMYFTIRSVSPDLWQSQPAKLDVPFSLANTIVLVLSSVWCQMGVFAAERFQPAAAGAWWTPWTLPARLGQLGDARSGTCCDLPVGAVSPVAGQVYEYAAGQRGAHSCPPTPTARSSS